MTGETHIIAAALVASPPTRDLAPKATAPPPPANADLKPAAPDATHAQVTPPPSFPVSLQFDQAAHRFFIEARDSSGLVVLQIPFKAAVAASAGASSASARGQRVNSKA